MNNSQLFPIVAALSKGGGGGTSYSTDDFIDNYNAEDSNVTAEKDENDKLILTAAGGTGAVDSVNGKTGDVELVADDIPVTNSTSVQDNLERIDEELGRLEDEKQNLIASVEITGVPSTATSGTLTEEQLATLQADKENVIVFNNEIYKLNDNGHETGILGYSHTGVENSVFMLKNITVTISTRGWVLTEQEVEDPSGAAWGSITGTLANQTDLQTALDGKAADEEFTGTDGTTAGTAGLVPAPLAADAGKFLKADGTWAEAGGGSGPTVVQTLGQSTTDVISQKAVTDTLFYNNNPQSITIGDYLSGFTPRGTVIGARTIQIGASNSTTAVGPDNVLVGNNTAVDNQSVRYAVAVGPGAYVSSNYSTAVGSEAYARSGSTYSVALGTLSDTSSKGEVSVGGSRLGTNGYNNTQYRLLTNVYDGQSAHDAATYGQLQALEARIAALEAQLGA